MRENRTAFVKFIMSVVVFVLLAGVSLGGYFAVQYIRGKNSPSGFGPELYYALDMAETNTEYTKVIIGDSVARLIFHRIIRMRRMRSATLRPIRR